MKTKIYFIQLSNDAAMVGLIRFAILYNIKMYFTWQEEAFFSTNYVATISDEGDAKISTEEKEKLIRETFANQIRKVIDL